jgi:ATP-dependent Lon protease
VISSATGVKTMPGVRRANRDLAMQLAAVRALAGTACRSPVPAAVAEDRPGHGVGEAEADGEDIEVREPPDALPLSSMRPLFQAKDIVERLASARRMRQDTREGLVAALERALKAGPMRHVGVPGSSVGFDELRMDFPHFREVLDFVWRRAVLAGSVAGAEFRLPPILLDGPPGCGKTAFAERLAHWLGVPIARVDMSALHATFSIMGLDAGYSTGKPGIIWDLLQGEYLCPVVLLDEVDKPHSLGSEGSAAFLLGLLEPVSACRFQDAFVGVPVDASHVQWLATSNDVSAVDAPLRSRFRVFEVREPRGDECLPVMQSVYREMRKREAWAKAFPDVLPPSVVGALIDRSAREVRQALEEACAAAVAQGRRELLANDVPCRRSRSKPSIGFVPAGQTGVHQ